MQCPAIRIGHELLWGGRASVAASTQLRFGQGTAARDAADVPVAHGPAQQFLGGRRGEFGGYGLAQGVQCADQQRRGLVGR
ncbi:hypothetical protein D3C71_1926420 [compost metagenome]